MDIIKLTNVYKNYNLGKTFVYAIRGISLNIKKGSFTAIAGPSGSGKSTLLNMIGCLDYPTKGEVWLEDQKVSNMSEGKLNEVRLNKIGFIFQSFNLIPVLNVYENIELPLLIKKNLNNKINLFPNL